MTKRCTRRAVVPCAHTQVLACRAVRDSEQRPSLSLQHRTLLICKTCGHGMAVDLYHASHPASRSDGWRPFAPLELSEENEGARIEIIAGPSDDLADMTRACLLRNEEDVLRHLADEQRDFLSLAGITPTPSTSGWEPLQQYHAGVREEISARYRIARERVHLYDVARQCAEFAAPTTPTT